MTIKDCSSFYDLLLIIEVRGSEFIDACAANNVVIEINAHPRRLDMSWTWIEYALSKDVLVSINPDAHAIEEFSNTRYGVLVAQKRVGDLKE